MTIFHAIKFSDVDIDNNDQLKILPVEVVSTWRNRMIDYAVDQAKSCVHLDKTGNAQVVIDAIADYRAGKITKEEMKRLSDAYYSASAYSAYSVSAAHYAVFAAAYAYSATHYAAHSTHYARKSLGMSPTWSQVQAEHDILFKKWLTEELMMFEMEVTN